LKEIYCISYFFLTGYQSGDYRPFLPEERSLAINFLFLPLHKYNYPFRT